MLIIIKLIPVFANKLFILSLNPKISVFFMIDVINCINSIEQGRKSVVTDMLTNKH